MAGWDRCSGVSTEITARQARGGAAPPDPGRAGGLVEAAPVAIVGIDPEGKVTSWYGGAEKMFGWYGGRGDRQAADERPAREAGRIP